MAVQIVSPHTSTPGRGVRTIFLVASSQILGLGGALTLANILRELIFWKEILLSFIGGWVEFVRPIITFLFSWAFDLLHFHLTPFWKDYLAVGSIVGIGFFRHFIILSLRSKEVGEAGGFNYQPLVPLYPSPWQKYSPLLLFVLSPVLWPMTVFVFALTLLFAHERMRFFIYSMSSIILPFYYLILLIAFNEFVLR